MKFILEKVREKSVFCFCHSSMDYVTYNELISPCPHSNHQWQNLICFSGCLKAFADEDLHNIFLVAGLRGSDL